jgi:hypothetical protein
MIEVEHLVYGSFSFDGSAQHIAAQSKGIDTKTRREITTFCDTWGDCKNLRFYSSLNQIWLEDESEPKVAVIKITHHGRDFSGRGGALLRHALVLREKAYEKLQFNPFKLNSLSIFKADWRNGDRCETLYLDSEGLPKEDLSLIPQELYPVLQENLRSHLEGLALLSYRNINTPTSDSYLRFLFSLIPSQRRKRLALTTFAFRKNHDYQIGCIYSPERVPEDNWEVEFERKAGLPAPDWGNELISDYLSTLFSRLRQGAFSQVEEHIDNYPDTIKA